MLRQFIIIITMSLSATLSNSTEAHTEQNTQSVIQKAEQGDANAQGLLGIMYIQGQGVRQDYVQARQWFAKAAEQGNAEAQSLLGMMYEEGLGVRQDYAQAKEFFGKACDEGYQPGCDAYKKLNNR